MENKLIDDSMKLGFGMMRLPRVEGTKALKQFVCKYL